MVKLVTHNQGFHADDVMAYAILQEVLTKRGETWSIERTRDQAIIDAADIAFDSGYQYDPERNRYDHHQVGRAGARDNGVLYASAGLVWKHFGRELCSSDAVWEAVDKGLIQEMDAVDNGQDYVKLNFPDSGYTSLTIHIAHFEPPIFELKTPEMFLESFERASEFARGILVRMITNLEAFERAFVEASEVYHQSRDKEILVFEKNYERPTWKRLSQYPEPIFVVYNNPKNNDWKVESIPVSMGTFTGRKYAPESWRGLEYAEMQKASGVADATFCHPSGFLFGAKSFEGAMKLAKLALLM